MFTRHSFEVPGLFGVDAGLELGVGLRGDEVWLEDELAGLLGLELALEVAVSFRSRLTAGGQKGDEVSLELVVGLLGVAIDVPLLLGVGR